jgi:pimeloyl-ACP methyl ester carboxylesterase
LGGDPAIVLMHGSPDDSRIYDRLLPLLSSRRRVVRFDFLGYGSGRPSVTNVDPNDHRNQIDAVIDQLGLDEVVLVAHEASGPDATDLAILSCLS